jgi:hypothetical protein
MVTVQSNSDGILGKFLIAPMIFRPEVDISFHTRCNAQTNFLVKYKKENNKARVG